MTVKMIVRSRKVKFGGEIYDCSKLEINNRING